MLLTRKAGINLIRTLVMTSYMIENVLDSNYHLLYCWKYNYKTGEGHDRTQCHLTHIYISSRTLQTHIIS